MDAVGTLLAEGLAQQQAGDPATAERRYRQVLGHDPTQADARHLLGLCLHAQGRTVAALAELEQAHALRPGEALFAGNLGRVLLATGDAAAAERVLRPAAMHDPGLNHELGVALLRQGRAAEAEAVLRRAPSSPATTINLAAARLAQGQAAEAAALLDAVLAATPDEVPARCGRAAALRALGRTEEALADLRHAAALRPDAQPIATQLGNLLAEAGQFDDALALLRPFEDADGLNNLGVALTAAGSLDEAEAVLARALALAPAHADAAYSRATALLLAGRLREAWPGFEQRWHRRGFVPPFRHPSPRWQGEATGGRLLLLHAEQGLGDTIQMARFLPALAARHRLALALPRPLHRLLSPLAPGADIHDLAAPLPPADLHLPLMSLPSLLTLDLAALPGPMPYLRADPARAAAWAARLAGLAGMRVGLAWAGNPSYPADAVRSLPPALLAPLAEIPGLALVSLQKGAAAPAAITDWTDRLHDLAETAALIDGLDLVVSVDTAVAHLAAAMAKPVWLLNRFAPCWRWMLGRDDSPWYPTLRQFRQPSPGDWPRVLADVRAALAQAVSSACAASSARSGVTPSPGPVGTCTWPAAAFSTSGTTSRVSA